MFCIGVTVLLQCKSIGLRQISIVQQDNLRHCSFGGSDGELKSNRLIHFVQIEAEIESF